MMSSDSIAFSVRSTAGSHSPTGAIEVEQQSKETPPPLGYVTPAPSVLKRYSSKNMGSFRFKRYRGNNNDSVVYLPVVRSSSTGRRLLLNVDCFETGASSFPTTLDLRNASPNEFMLATPKQVSKESQHPAIERPTVSMSRLFSTANSQVNSNDEILSEPDRYVSLSDMFLPIQEDALEADNTVMPGRFGLRLKPKKLTGRYKLFKE